MKYLQRVTKTVTLPSGATVTVRQQTKLEAILIGQPPSVFKKLAKAREREQPEPETTPEEDAAIVKHFANVERILLTRCVDGPMKFDGEELTIWDGEPNGCPEGALSWAMLQQADKEAIIKAINDLTSGTTDGEAVTTFPEKNGRLDGRGQAGEAIRGVANGIAEPHAA